MANVCANLNEVTRMLGRLEQGDPWGAERLFSLVYDELRKLAAGKLAHERPGQTLQATALVHEAYLRLIGTAERPASISCKVRLPFLKAIATPATPRILDLQPGEERLLSYAVDLGTEVEAVAATPMHTLATLKTVNGVRFNITRQVVGKTSRAPKPPWTVPSLILVPPFPPGFRLARNG